MSNLSFRKTTFPRMKLILNSTCMHLKLQTTTPERNSSLFFRCQIYENQWFYIVISLSTGLWEMHFCSMVQTKPHYGSWKTPIKPLEIVQIGFRRLQNVIIKVLHILTYLSNSVKWAPRAPGERPKALRGPPIAPTSIKINVNEPKSM